MVYSAESIGRVTPRGPIVWIVSRRAGGRYGEGTIHDDEYDSGAQDAEPHLPVQLAIQVAVHPDESNRDPATHARGTCRVPQQHSPVDLTDWHGRLTDGPIRGAPCPGSLRCFCGHD